MLYRFYCALCQPIAFIYFEVHRGHKILMGTLLNDHLSGWIKRICFGNPPQFAHGVIIAWDLCVKLALEFEQSLSKKRDY